MQAAETSRNDVLSVFFEGSSAPPPPPRNSSYNPVSASVSVLTRPAPLPCLPHTLAASLRRGHLPPLYYRGPFAPTEKSRAARPKGGYQVSTRRYRSRFLRSNTRPTPACDSATWGQDRYNSCSVVIAGPWQMDFPSSQAPRRPSSGCRSSTAEKTSAASASRSRTADGSPPTNGNELHFGRIAEMKPETSVEEGEQTAPTELETPISKGTPGQKGARPCPG